MRYSPPENRLDQWNPNFSLASHAPAVIILFSRTSIRCVELMKEALLSSNNFLQEGERVFIKNAFRTNKLSLQFLRLQCTVHFVRSPLDLARAYEREYEQCKDITPSLRVDRCDSLMVHLHASLVIALLNNKHPSQCFALARLETSDFEPDRVIYQKVIAALEAS